MTNKYLEALYDKSALIKEMIDASGATITSRGCYVDTVTGVTNASKMPVDSGLYIICTELPELLAPSANKVETSESFVKGLGSMVTYTCTYDNDSIDLDYYEFDCDPDSPNYDRAKVRELRKQIDELDKKLLGLVADELLMKDVEIDCTATYTPKDLNDKPTHSVSVSQIPIDVYLKDAFETHAHAGKVGINHVDRTFERVDGLDWCCTHVTVTSEAELYHPSDCLLGERYLRQHWDYRYEFTPHVGELGAGEPFVNQTYPNWNGYYDSMHDLMYDDLNVDVFDPDTGCDYPLVADYANAVGARPY